MIAAKFPALVDADHSLSEYLDDVGLDRQLFDFAAEAMCAVVYSEDINLDIADLVPSIRNNAAFKAIAGRGAELGLFQRRSRGGKSFITNIEETLKIMVHNTDAATALGTHIPTFASKRRRHGTAYVHSEAQGEMDFGETVIDFGDKHEHSDVHTIDVCIFAEKVDGGIDCRIELLINARLNDRGDAFETCSKRFGMKFMPDQFTQRLSEDEINDEDDFSDVVKPKIER